MVGILKDLCTEQRKWNDQITNCVCLLFKIHLPSIFKLHYNCESSRDSQFNLYSKLQPIIRRKCRSELSDIVRHRKTWTSYTCKGVYTFKGVSTFGWINYLIKYYCQCFCSHSVGGNLKFNYINSHYPIPRSSCREGRSLVWVCIRRSGCNSLNWRVISL